MRSIHSKFVVLFALGLTTVGGAQAQFSGGASGAMSSGSIGSGASAAPAAPVDAAPAANLLNSLRGQGNQPGAQQPGNAEAAKSSTEPAADVKIPPAKAAAPTQFQRYVQETTGRMLPMYGRDLFDSPQAYAADSMLPAPSDYLLGPGDEVQLQVWGPLDFNASLVIDRNGQVNIPRVGVVTLAGIAVRDLDKTLRGHLSKVLTNYQLNANLGRLRGIQVYVVGQANRPGTFHLSSLSTLVNALFASGGPSANGSMRNIELKRGGRTISTLDLYDFISRGDKSRDLQLASGDIIVIPPVGPRVAITGAFDQAAIYELKSPGSSVADILALGGGVPALATAQKALLERIVPESNPPRQVLDVTLNEQGLRQPLRDGDVLTLLGISPAFANAVTLQGAVAAPLRYRWFEGMKILDLIPERDALITSDYYRRKNLLVQNAEAMQNAISASGSGSSGGVGSGSSGSGIGSTSGSGGVAARIRGLVDQINWDYAVIERLDRNTLTNQLIPFNLGRAVLQKDASQNLPLLSGDVVTILSQTDLRVPQDRQSRLVRVEGEVATPGVYQTLPGETLPQLLARVGGLTTQAYLFGAELSRESVRNRQQENLDALIRRLEAQLQAQAGVVASNRNVENAAQAQLVQQQQQAQLKSQVERLRSFKSNGRLALELDTQARNLSDLPALPLEDGDRIWVPPTPGHVGAFGSVNNENVVIFKPGKTVQDVIKSAGLTEDAEPDQAFVLRADGTIIARRDHGGFFGNGFESLKVMPGDTVVVPAQLDRESRYNLVTRVFKDWTQILSNFGLGVAAIRAVSKL